MSLEQETFLREYANYLDPKEVCEEFLSIDFIRQFKDKLDWDELTWSQIFDQKQIEEFLDKINWYNALTNQNLSKEFLLKHKYDIPR